MKGKLFFSFAIFSVLSLCGCDLNQDKPFEPKCEITVVSREEGSGTRSAFTELAGVEIKNADGKKRDLTTEEALITNNTAVMMTTVSSDRCAIGYISLGSLNAMVEAFSIDGVYPSSETINDQTYKISRPFLVATKGVVNDVTQNFIEFILSSEGQAVITKTGYVSIGNGGGFIDANPSGKIVIGGSSSVNPVMEKLREAYLQRNPKAEIEIQMSDSSTGIKSLMDGICDIAMSSRALKQSEIESGILPQVIALDGIVVIANGKNPNRTLTIEQVRAIYSGEITHWYAVQ